MRWSKFWKKTKNESWDPCLNWKNIRYLERFGFSFFLIKSSVSNISQQLIFFKWNSIWFIATYFKILVWRNCNWNIYSNYYYKATFFILTPASWSISQMKCMMFHCFRTEDAKVIPEMVAPLRIKHQVCLWGQTHFSLVIV